MIDANNLFFIQLYNFARFQLVVREIVCTHSIAFEINREFQEFPKPFPPPKILAIFMAPSSCHLSFGSTRRP